MTAYAALYRLGLDWSDVDQMIGDLLDAIEQANRDLIAEFGGV